MNSADGMHRDTDGELLPKTLWHGSHEGLPDKLASCQDLRWWKIMDHDTFLRGQGDDVFDDDLDHELRTAYGNIAYEILRHSDDESLRALAADGIEALGENVSILFVSDDREYVERAYGATTEIDLESEGVLAAIWDNNVTRPGVGCWFLVCRAGCPMPVVRNKNPYLKA